jgi:MoaA/NifB/PqqE/SkfB family radical SAM enzyme
MRKRTVSFSKNATNLFFHILTQCNLSCTHCYINPEQHGKKPLPLATIEAWLSAFSEKAASANVVFLGGEPTLHPDLSLAVQKARALGFQSITIDTNGYLFHDILSKLDPEALDYISFSLDGASRAVNDGIRGKGAYDSCLAGIRKAAAGNFSTSLIYTVSRMNLHELSRMPALLGDLGVARFFIQVIGIRGRWADAGRDRHPLQVSRNEWLAHVPETAEKAARLGITVTYPKVFLEPDEPFACAGKVADNYFIFPNGRVYRCPLCEDYPVHSLCFQADRLVRTGKINESDLFELSIDEGCVINRLVQPGNLSYAADGKPAYKIACCLLKEEIRPGLV